MNKEDAIKLADRIITIAGRYPDDIAIRNLYHCATDLRIYFDYADQQTSQPSHISGQGILVKGELIFEFTSMQHWINKAQYWFKPYRMWTTICIDKEGNNLHCGEDFEIAEKHNLYPVKVYKLFRTAEAKSLLNPDKTDL